MSTLPDIVILALAVGSAFLIPAVVAIALARRRG